ncbi:DNA-directed RNA polymerase subunit beta' [Coriobacterium glomerans PW2]|uniref:DNA-directed RNA polymerase subunit beta' n=1 Tax=Coriobacterium glomerans (strain ATCC 49209 / DSM 20642 / JCM 10262 / PW2) TaxID=700015 RepID=F2N8Q4_CORGP|nr:DNA-directed RNA polymerase subunit beta' [Coriobacterium glomerans]AEB07437.1 DNA-directed RNA polymerase subunit beta' [Coriobacterium glomerans PW2]
MADFEATDFEAVKVSLASADQIRSWSHGEVKKPETINYRTLKPEKDGLFCEKIFGPAKDWECSCGKYKGIRFKGIVCERCGVEVTSAKVRRERMGHIELAAPVSHIWYFKSPTSFPMSRLLDLKSKDLEKVLYFASYIITKIDIEARDADADDLREELSADLEEIDAECARQIEALKEQGMPENFDEFSDEEPLSAEEIAAGIIDIEEECKDERQLRSDAFQTFMKLSERDLISDEPLFREMKRYYSMYFSGNMGAEAIRDLLCAIDLDEEADKLKVIIADEEGQKQKKEKAVKRLEVVDAFLKGGNAPANMILDVVPVIPPDLRPMVQLDGGRFAASDLNDLYRRVINRNNRLKRLLDLDAPAIIVNNEKRMLQEAVDALFDNGRRGRPVSGRGGRPLKSLAEALKGKQGRFRQNLLGKRVDYSGRSVIVTDPELKLHQCGLPKTMALELFKPFVMKRLVELGKVENIKGAKRAIDRSASFVWDILEEVIDGRLVLLNRAPTLHRLSIQAFEPVLVEGKAIHLHPLVCAPFNADFDGDQMSVHVPLSLQAQAEARVLMLSSNNLRSPASGKPVNVPSQDMIIGVYYLTQQRDGLSGEGHVFASLDDALNAYDSRSEVDLQAKIKVRVSAAEANVEGEDGRRLFRVCDERGQFTDYDVTGAKTCRIETTIGRIIFNRQCLPADYEFINYKMVKGDVGKLVSACCDRYPSAEVGPILDAIKYAGFHFATRAGLTISLWDALIPDEKPELLARAQTNVDTINENFEDGFINEQERHTEVVNEWTAATEKVAALMLDLFDEENPIYMMADSGARGTKTQLRQLGGMRGLMTDMSGETIDLPIKANFREGLLPLEYFISTYGARKGLVDTASHTSDSGYLTRRLVDVAQDVIVREEDCGTTEGATYDLVLPGSDDIDTELVGRCFIEDVTAPDGTVLFKAGSYIESVEDLERMVAAGLTKIRLRALLTCRSKFGVCQKCYGWDLSTRLPVAIGTAVGIIAAQSIGEPGTQLTMRTIHSGGVAGADDITQGLPTVGRMFDVVGNVNEKILGREADLALHSGVLSIKPEKSEYVLTITDADDAQHIYDEIRVPASVRFMPGIADGCSVRAGDQITKGFVNFRSLRHLTDIESTMHTFVKSVKDVYTSQGVDLNDKHIEVIARQMLRRVQITNPGDSKYLLGQYVDRYEFADEVERVARLGGAAPAAEPTILGTLKVAASIDSWLSSASFIRTAGVLTEAAIEGKVDHLLDLKSNVIVGKKIPAGTGLRPYDNVGLTYRTPEGYQLVEGSASSAAKSLPDWAPPELKELDEELPQQLDWAGFDEFGVGDGSFTRNGRTISADDAKLYLFDDLGVSQRWTNKFSEVGIETVGDLVGKSEEDLLRIDGIGAKAIEELRDGLEAHNLLYILESSDDVADEEDLSQLLQMVFSPDGPDDILLGASAPRHHFESDEEMIGAPVESEKKEGSTPGIINEDMASLDELLNKLVDTDGDNPEDPNDMNDYEE